MPWGLHVKWGSFSWSPQGKYGAVVHPSMCSHRVMCTGAGSNILADVSFEQYGLHRAQAKQVLLPEPKDCSHGEEQEEEQSQETPESWISCSSSLFSPSLRSSCPSQTDSRAVDILFPSVGATTHLACDWSRP